MEELDERVVQKRQAGLHVPAGAEEKTKAVDEEAPDSCRDDAAFPTPLVKPLLRLLVSLSL